MLLQSQRFPLLGRCLQGIKISKNLRLLKTKKEEDTFSFFC